MLRLGNPPKSFLVFSPLRLKRGGRTLHCCALCLRYSIHSEDTRDPIAIATFLQLYFSGEAWMLLANIDSSLKSYFKGSLEIVSDFVTKKDRTKALTRNSEPSLTVRIQPGSPQTITVILPNSVHACKRKNL